MLPVLRSRVHFSQRQVATHLLELEAPGGILGYTDD
jgi:hypothetical protein